MELREEIINREKSLLTPEVRRSVVKLKELLSDEFIEVGTSGACFGLAEVLKYLTSEYAWSAMTQDWQFRALAEGVVQTIYKVCIEKPEAGSTRFSQRTSIWRQEGECWKMVYHQGTAEAPFEVEA